MGVCLSCLGLRGHNQADADRQRLLYDDYPSAQHYGTWGAGHTIPPENLMSPEEIQLEQSALDNISRGLSDHIVEIFPHNLGGRPLGVSGSQLVNGNGASHTISSDQNGSTAHVSSQHHDILLSLIPGDKSKRSIRIYPASRPTSKSGQSLRSKSSITGGMNGTNGRKREDSSVLVTLDVNLP
ncbi:hypothetical protein A1O7_00188 [Cladophialophora yegresii CBS 114405]|uniref:Uncharacterized protein n=1 Tax=Cladophialophora yegresii CBS 114405 TaxID=1182544 RepID=W9W7C6_9EURO|nr:uncharacterized protein A1O7_00188 [Cladophialophora yegresii CBS 114405]EXJ63853.1 hypothetical protein A1O7_00188 [Cladophialophora yegresii CBS 114405]